MKDNAKFVILASVSVLAFFVLAQASLGAFGCGPGCLYPPQGTKAAHTTAFCEIECAASESYDSCFEDCMAGGEEQDFCDDVEAACLTSCAGLTGEELNTCMNVCMAMWYC